MKRSRSRCCCSYELAIIFLLELPPVPDKTLPGPALSTVFAGECLHE